MEELLEIKRNIKDYVIVENEISKDDRDEFYTVLSYVDTKISGFKQTNAENILQEEIEEMINTSQFKPLKSLELIEILGLTIKKKKIMKIN